MAADLAAVWAAPEVAAVYPSGESLAAANGQSWMAEYQLSYLSNVVCCSYTATADSIAAIQIEESEMSRVTICPDAHLASLLLLGIAMQVSGCASDSYAARGAGQGATTGALAGAVGGMATALIFGGNVGEAAARGAVYGGASGAVVGGMSGANVDKQVAAQEQAEREKKIAEFRDEIGTDAFNGFVALAECKHDIAVANAREARKARNRDHALAGLWIEILAEVDRENRDAASDLLPELVSSDKRIETVSDAESRIEGALGRMREIRAEYDLPEDCSS